MVVSPQSTFFFFFCSFIFISHKLFQQYNFERSSLTRVLFKLDSLSQRQLLGVVDGACRPPHVLLPGIRSRLSSTTSCLLTTKCSSNFSSRGGNIHIHDATVRTLGAQPLENIAKILGEYRRAETPH